MGIFDFFNNKKKEREQQEQLRIKQEAERKRQEQQRLQQEQARRNTTTTTNVSSLKILVDKCVELESKGKITELQNCLFQLYNQFNKPGAGKKLISYPEKDNLTLCFAFMLQYDWVHDSDIREVWAENGFYCIMEYIDHQPYGRQGQVEAMIILFTLLCVGRDSLKPKVQDILNKAKKMGNPVFHQDDYTIGAQNVIDQISAYRSKCRLKKTSCSPMGHFAG